MAHTFPNALTVGCHGLHGDDGLQEPGAVLGAGAALETHHGLNAEKNHPTQALDLDGSGWIWMDLDGSG